jgi:hypothetical protein
MPVTHPVVAPANTSTPQTARNKDELVDTSQVSYPEIRREDTRSCRRD